MEEWRELKVLETVFVVSNRGRVYKKGKGLRTTTPTVGNADGKGYLNIGTSKNSDGKAPSVFIHRLVAMAFVPNPEGLATVNHRDGNKTNNNADNLEWMSLSDNLKHAHKAGLIDQRRCVTATPKSGGVGYWFPSMADGARFTGATPGNIIASMQRQGSTGGYRWAFV